MTRKAVAGSPVNANDPIFEIDNLAVVWVEGDVFETQLPEITPGVCRPMSRFRRIPDKVFDGKVQGVLPSLDPAKRTARLRVVLPNSEGLLKPEMFATLSIVVGKGEPGNRRLDRRADRAGRRPVRLRQEWRAVRQAGCSRFIPR